MTRIAEVTRGHRRIAGTDWPVEDVLYRDSIGRSRPRWVVARGLCNGAPRSSETYLTKRAAMEALGA